MLDFNFVLVPFASKDIWYGNDDFLYREYFIFGIRVAKMSKNLEIMVARTIKGK